MAGAQVTSSAEDNEFLELVSAQKQRQLNAKIGAYDVGEKQRRKDDLANRRVAKAADVDLSNSGHCCAGRTWLRGPAIDRIDDERESADRAADTVERRI